MNCSTSIIPANEAERLAAVRRYDILDTPADGAFDRIAALASRIFKVPVAIISIVDRDRIWFKSHHGVDVEEIGREPGLCASAILQDEVYTITDAKADPRSLANPLVAGEFGLQFYAAAPLHTHEGFNLGTLCVIDRQTRSITQEEKDSLRDLATLVIDELELRIAAKKVIETEVALREAALEANRAKSEFLATMSHEIRTPMNGVIGMTELLMNTELTSQQRQWVKTIRNSGESLLMIINDILDFSKIESQKLELEEQPFDLLDCLSGVLDLLTPKAAEKGLELAYFVKPNTPNLAIGDSTRLRQILINLIGNAIKFTSTGGVQVSVTARKTGDEKQEIQFAVQDTGIGIPADGMERLFKSFSQVDSSTTRQYGGTGLGLAISKRLSELMGGRIWVESTVGQGSTFYFTIVVPSVPEDVSAPLKEGLLRKGVFSPVSSFDSQLGKRLPLRILVAEDSSVNQQVAIYFLEQLGYQADIVVNGLEVLEALRRQPYDVVLMDVQMPLMDGLSTSRRIREEYPNGNCPRIIATTANAMQGDKEECFKAGMDDYLSKPLRLEELVVVLSRCQPKDVPLPISQSCFPDRVEAIQDVPVERLSAATALAPEKPIDPEIWRSFCSTMTKTNSAIVGKLIKCYLEESPKLLQSMKVAIAEKDSTQLQQASHTLKASSATLGATHLAAMCKDLEALSRTRTFTGASEMVQHIETEYDRVKLALEKQ